MAIYDESGEYERVECPVCHVDTDESCDHLLAFADVTFNEEPCGAVGDHLRTFETIISEAFAPRLGSETVVKWKNFTVRQLWEALLEEDCDPEDFTLPSPQFYELVIELLAAAGGWEHPGSLIVGSGGRCESAVRLMYAENPQKVVADALKMLPTQLVEAEPTQRRRRKK
jgi:hypothetical protein